MISVNTLVKDLVVQEGVDPDTGEMIVDLECLSSSFAKWGKGITGDLIVEGHLSYLVPSSLILLLRTDPNILRERLLSRGYPEAKAQENAEAEAVSYLLFECMERETEALLGGEWTTMPEGSPIVLEIDATNMSPEGLADWVGRMVRARKEKGFIDMLPFRPPVVDWMEVVARWY